MIKPNGFPYNGKKYSLILASQAFSVLIFLIILIPRLVTGTDEQAFETIVLHEPSVVLSLLPQDSTHQVGEIVPLQLYVNLSNTSAANAFGVTLSYPTDYLRVVEIDTQGSVCTLFPENTVNNGIGEATLSCGLPNPGLTEPFGFLGTVQVELLKEGYANLSFKQTAQVLANDGLGTNILTSTKGSGINIVSREKIIVPPPSLSEEEPTAVHPKITLLPVQVISPTHPQQQEWYKERSATFEWENTSHAVSSYSFLLDSSPDTIPDPANGIETNTVSLSEIPDGTSYFHIMPIAKVADLPVTHFQLHVDTDTPRGLSVKSATSFGEDKYWTLEFDVEDYNGIDRFEILHTDGTVAEVNNPAQIILNDKFDNKITIVAYDLGGNSASIEYEIPLTQEPTVWEQVARFWGNFANFIRNF